MESTIQIPGINKRLTSLVVMSQILMLIWSFASSYLHSGPTSIYALTFIIYTGFLIMAWYTKNPLLYRLLLFGTVAGFVELIADHYLVETVDSLVYPEGEIMIWSSPLYMPFAWANVLVQLGYYGLLLTRWKGKIVASILIAIAGGMYIPLYEHLAKDAGWWIYKDNTAMIFNAPIYVILCEALISLSLPFFLVYAANKGKNSAGWLGLAGGLWILVAAVLSYTIAAN